MGDDVRVCVLNLLPEVSILPSLAAIEIKFFSICHVTSRCLHDFKGGSLLW